ncbi:MAG: 4-(cytidine 5'-diphospho)-2-C-methyl-D-erythritol kinase [Pseudomonadota bacterium]
MPALQVFAPAKVNLTLHITGQRTDGYHLLDTLVAFASVGDLLSLSPSSSASITVEGPEAADVPADAENLALRAAMLALGEHGAALTLEKHLPVASGVGGGSTDAAAALRGALALLDESAHSLLTLGPDILLETRFRPLLKLGADIPMCLLPRPLRARGIGERIAFVELPPLPAVMVNPRVALSTPDVFRALRTRAHPPMPEELPTFDHAATVIDWLKGQRNDLEEAAKGLTPAINAVMRALSEQPGCGLARMSGSGATCFGLFAAQDDAKAAAAHLGRTHPDWWVAGCILGDQSAVSLPRALA